MEPIPLNTTEYTIEVWDINGVYVMDVSDLIATSLRITLEVNTVEDISFTLDLVQFEKRCASVGANPRSILEPYRTDIRIRRNNEYLCGGQVVQVNINFNEQDTNKIEVKCTGYLNYFRDRYITALYRNKTYAEIAQQLITDTQSQPNLISNSIFYEDIGGWVGNSSGYVAWEPVIGHNYKGSLYVSVTTGTNTTGGARYSQAFLAGVTYTLTFWAKVTSVSGNIYINSGDGVFGSATVPDTEWREYTYTWTQVTSSTVLDIMSTSSMNFYIDDVVLTSSLDDPSYFDFGVTLGVDNASGVQEATRERTYDLQNVKDGIVNLTKLENDNFDFQFTADKVFNIYARLGSDRPEIELVYPQNISSIQVSRDASTLSNRIIGLGSGIGSERLETVATSYTSAAVYRVRERTETFNSVQESDTLDANTFGKLNVYQNIYEVPTLSVEANHLDLNDVKLGDAIKVRVDNSSFVTTINGMYRIMKMTINVNPNWDESVNLDMEAW
jgi:hypothetical protein